MKAEQSYVNLILNSIDAPYQKTVPLRTFFCGYYPDLNVLKSNIRFDVSNCVNIKFFSVCILAASRISDSTVISGYTIRS